MLSSTLVYNISGNIGENHLQHLQFVCSYGQLAYEETSKKAEPIQKLMVLVRDWTNVHEHAYGIIGGKNFLDKRLEIRRNQATEVKKLRQQIMSTFKEIECYLMPHPDLKVTQNPYFDGKVSDINEDFVNHLSSLFVQLFSPDKMSVKKVGGQVIRCKDLGEYFKRYFDNFQVDFIDESLLTFLLTKYNFSLVTFRKFSQFWRSMPYLIAASQPRMHSRCTKKI